MVKITVMIVALCGALVAAPTRATIISGTWNFSAAGGVTGSFSFTGLDSTQNYSGSTAAGFSVSTSFDTTGDGGNAFTFDQSTQHLVIGGLVSGVTQVIPPPDNDWVLSISNFPTGLNFLTFAYSPVVGSLVFDNATVAVTLATVPEPATLALLGLGLFGVAVARRRSH